MRLGLSRNFLSLKTFASTSCVRAISMRTLSSGRVVTSIFSMPGLFRKLCRGTSSATSAFFTVRVSRRPSFATA